MKLITSVGTGNYKKVTYTWNGKQCETDIFPEALVEWFKPGETVVFLTQESKRRYSETLQSRLQTRTRLKQVDIPDGHSEAEIWEIFDNVVSWVEEDEKVVIDITHAFRSLPLIFFVVTAYLRAVKKVEVCHVLYGCYISDNQPAPVIDLRLMLDLLDWMEGVRRFQELGDARFIGERLKETQNDLRRLYPERREPSKLKSAGKKLLKLSDELQNLRVIHAMETATRLVSDVKNASHEIHRWAKPFALLIDQVNQLVNQIAHDKPNVLDPITLQKQYHMISTLIHHQQLVQAVLLQREWLVNYVLWRTGNERNYLQREARESVEHELNRLVPKTGQERSRDSEYPETATESDPLPLEKHMGQDEIQSVAGLWASIRDLRNDFAHCGMRDNPEDIGSLKQKVCKFDSQFKELLKDVQTRP